MRKYLLMLIAMGSMTALKAQEMPLIISSNTVNFKAGTTHYKFTESGITKPTTGSDQMWDYASLKDEDSLEKVYTKSTNPAFSNTALESDIRYDFIIPNRVIEYSNFLDISTHSYARKGILIMDQQYPIGDLTGNPNDTFYVDSSNQVFQSDDQLLALPVSANDHWSSSYKTDLNFKITMATLGMNKTPGKRVSHFLVMDSVAAWGKVRTPYTDGKFQKVLMVQETHIQIDSFYLGGAPANPLILASFGLKQGDTTYTYFTYFYRDYSMLPMMTISYEDEKFSKPIAAIYTTDPYAGPSNILEVKNTLELQTYPNPIVDGTLNINFGKATVGNYMLNVRNSMGQVVYSSNLSGGNISSVQLPADLSSGIYFINISNDKNKVFNGKIMISK